MKFRSAIPFIACVALIVAVWTGVGSPQNLVQNQPVLIAATSIPTSGVTSSLGTPNVALYTVWFTNSNSSTVYCGLYASSPTLGTTALVGAQVAVPSGATQPVYFGPSNGVNKNYFSTGIFAGCSTTYLGSTGVAQNTVGVAGTYL